eukprot:4367755-Prymnesium_polylepis.3
MHSEACRLSHVWPMTYGARAAGHVENSHGATHPTLRNTPRRRPHERRGASASRGIRLERDRGPPQFHRCCVPREVDAAVLKSHTVMRDGAYLSWMSDSLCLATCS